MREEQEALERHRRVENAAARARPFVPRSKERVARTTESTERRAFASYLERRDEPGVFDAHRRPGWILDIASYKKVPDWRVIDRGIVIREH